MKQWPGPKVDFTVSSPPIEYDNYFDVQNPKQGILHIMVGDLQRICDYTKLGFQTEQVIPNDVQEAYQFLVSSGYTQYLIKG